MDTEQLSKLMLEFIETQDGEYDDEWYASPRDFAAVVLSDFAKHMGFNLDVPPYVRRKTVPEIDRAQLIKELMPKINELLEFELNLRGHK